MAKELIALKWIEDLLPEGSIRKPMFGGFAYYLEGKLILVLFEKSNHPGWEGCLFPVERENHPEIIKLFPFLLPHTVLSKWMYLSMQSENFDDSVEEMLKALRRRNPLFGVIPKAKNKLKQKKKSKKINTRQPRMFHEK